MPFVVTESCIKCKYTACVTVCPMDCFFEGPNFLVINPDECIDCSMCVPECPVNAIVGEREIAQDQRVFVDLNIHLAKSGLWPRITKSKPALDDADQWKMVSKKCHLLQRT